MKTLHDLELSTRVEAALKVAGLDTLERLVDLATEPFGSKEFERVAGVNAKGWQELAWAFLRLYSDALHELNEVLTDTPNDTAFLKRESRALDRVVRVLRDEAPHLIRLASASLE